MTREQILEVLIEAARSAGYPAAWAIGQAEQESGFDPDAESPAGAVGLMQLEPATALEWGITDPADLKDPAKNAQAGCHYMAYLTRRYDGNVIKALAAYNWGPGNIARHEESPAQWGGTSWIEACPGETLNYIQRVPSNAAKWQAWLDAGKPAIS